MEATAIRYAIALGILVGLLLSACAPRPVLGPAPQAEAAPDSAGAVRDEAARVVVTARLDGWRAMPANLAEVAAPVLVEIDNRSERPVRLQLSAFQLIRSDAASFRARSAASIRGSLRDARPTASPALPGGSPIGYSITAEAGGFVSGRSADRGGLDYDVMHFGRRFAPAREIELPSRDMQQLALGEGVIAAAEKKSGFLYFEPFGPDTRYAVLQMELIDAQTGRSMGTVRLPFAKAGSP